MQAHGGRLSGVSVLVAGAGLAGLSAARDLAAAGAAVTVVEARDRVGGRVLTLHEGFVEGQHAEAGGEFIDEAHEATRTLAAELGLKLRRVLRAGFGLAQPDAQGRTRIARRSIGGGWERLARQLDGLVRCYRLTEQRWDSPIADDLARRSVADWLRDTGADADLRATVSGLRGFFLADPEDLSLLALVDQFASGGSAGVEPMYRIDGGNDRLARALAAPLGERLHLNTELVAVSHRGGRIVASLKHQRQTASFKADYLIFALPATLLRRIPVMPALPAPQHDAIARLRYGSATKTLLQFSRRSWRAVGRPRAFGSPLPFGAVWDGNEEQRGRAGILALLAGGSAGAATRALVQKGGIKALVQSLDWLGADHGDFVGWRQVVWDGDPWARGGYAYLDPSFDPALREWLWRPAGPLFFAGEHTSQSGQGYMNGAIESGRRAAAEVAATHRLKAAFRPEAAPM